MAHRSFTPHPIVVRELTVIRAVDVTPRMRRVTVGGPQLQAFHNGEFNLPAFTSTGFDDHVKLVFALEGDAAGMLPIQRAHGIDWTEAEHRALRDYTVRRVDLEAGEVDLDFVRHGDGPAASWAEDATAGARLFSIGPKSSITLPAGIDHIVLVGDETAIPAIGRYFDDRPADVPVTAVISTGDPSGIQALAAREGDQVHWVANGDLVATVQTLTWPTGSVFVWAGAESAELLPLRRWVSREKQVPKTHIDITGYWHAVAEVGADDDERVLDEHAVDDLLNPIAWFAVRAALRIKLLDAVAATPRTPAQLARRCGTTQPALVTLATALVAYGVLELRDGRYGLGPVGEHVLGDDHLLGSLADTEESRTILALAGLDELLTGTAPAIAAVPDEVVYGERFDAEIGFDFVAPALGDHLGAAARIAVTGPGAMALSKVVGDRAAVTVAETAAGLSVLRSNISEPGRIFAEAMPGDQDLVVAASALGHLTDENAVNLLRELRAAGQRGWIVELIPSGEITEHDAEHGLLTFAATGAAPRGTAELSHLAERAGWTVTGTTALGWNYVMVALI